MNTPLSLPSPETIPKLKASLTFFLAFFLAFLHLGLVSLVLMSSENPSHLHLHSGSVMRLKET